MKVDQPKARARGRPRTAHTKNRRKKSPLPTKTTTTTMDNNLSTIVICSDSNSSHEKSIVEVVSLSDTIITDVSESSCTIQKKVSDVKSVDMKEARVLLENIFHSKLISPKQRTQLLNRCYNAGHSTQRSVPKKKKQKKKKEPKATSICSSGSSVVFLNQSTPIVKHSNFNPILTLEKIKVEPPEKTSPNKTYKDDSWLLNKFIEKQSLEKNLEKQFLDRSIEKHSLDEKLSHTAMKLESEFSNASRTSADRPVSILGSSSSEQLQSKKSKTESRGTKRKRSETSFDDNSPVDGSLKKRGRPKISAKRRKRNSSEPKINLVKSITSQSSNNEGSKRAPKRNDSPKTPLKHVTGIFQTEKTPPAPNITVNIQLNNNLCSFINELGNGNFSDEPPILSPKINRNGTPVACHNRTQVDVRVNDRSPSAVCISRTEVDTRPDDKLPNTSFTLAETEVGLDLDVKHCCLDSIARAIENDLAAGNRLTLLGDIENLEMPADLTNDTCCLKKMIINGSATADHPENLQEDKEKSRNSTERDSDNQETSSDISSSTTASRSNRKRERPAIITDDILPKGTVSISRNDKKRQRMSRLTVASETAIDNDKINQNLSTNGNNATYNFIDQNVANLPSSLDDWAKDSEIESIPQENTVNDRLSDKHGCIIDDALNNNQEVNFANKNSLNSEKPDENINSYSSATRVSPDFEEEYDALDGLLTSFGDTNDPNSLTEVNGCEELANNHPKSIAEVNDCPELDYNHLNSVTEVNGCPEFDNNLPNSITAVDVCPELANIVTNSLTEVERNLELDNEEREVDAAIESFTASVNSLQMKNIAKKEEAMQIASLTVDNLDKFDCAPSSSATASRNASTAPSSGTESSEDSQSEDVTERSCLSINIRRRRYVPGKDSNTLAAPRRRIRLNRGNWSTDRKEKSEFPSDANYSFAQSKKNMTQGSNKNDNKIEHSQRIIASTVTNRDFRKASSPAKYVQKRDNTVQKAVPGFGERVLNGVSDSKSETDDNSNNSSGSSSSSSSSDSSSSSSSSSDSDSSVDEAATEKVVEKVSERIPEEATREVNETFLENIPTTVTNRDPRKVPTYAEKPGNTVASVSNTKSRVIQTTIEDEAERDLKEVEDYERAAGSSIDNDLGKEKKDEDQDDCISLFANSSCMSRCDSPPLNEPPKRRRSPLYKKMKSSNIDCFANANKQQCDADIAAYKAQVNIDKDDKKTQKNTNNQKTANEPRPNSNSMPSLDPRDEMRIRSTVQTDKPDNKPDLRSTLNGRCDQDPKYLFFGQCYSWLKFGKCTHTVCRFSHILKPQLQRIDSHQTAIMEGIVNYAIANRYRFFLSVVHSKVIATMSTEGIIHYYKHLYNNQLLKDMIVESTTEALIQRGMSVKEIVTTFDNVINSSDTETPNMIIRVMFPKVKESGTLWDTLRTVISKVLPSALLVETLIEECINDNKSKEHFHDVYENLIKGLPLNILVNVRTDPLMKFHEYFKKSVSNANVVNIAEPQHEPQQNDQIASSIASPDPVEPPIVQTLPKQLTEMENSVSSTPTAKKSKMGSESASQRSCTESPIRSYSIATIDNLPPPKSPYRDVLWKFHWDLQGVQEGLKHRDYTHVISILTQNIHHPSRLPHMEGFYNILCNEIMSSKQHLAEIVRLTVQSGASNDLRQFVFDLGVHVLTKLADIGAWVLAHELLKTFQVYGTYNTCAYTLLAVEIYIANYRPLKALELLKQSQLKFTNTMVWNQMWCPNDVPLRVTAMELLLSSLCDGHAQHALSLLEFILNDQCSSFKPINVSRYVDKIARALLIEKHTSSIIDFGRVVMQANLSLSRSTFRALINSIFHNDRILAKQLHGYATCLGAYGTAKISRTTHMVINNDWTEEEMFLMFSGLIKDLSTNIGHAIGRLRPRQLAVFLILETIPTEKHLCLDICNGPTTNSAINKRKAIVRNVLEHFDPKIKLIQKSQGRLCKVQSTSLVDYLKAGHFDN